MNNLLTFILWSLLLVFLNLVPPVSIFAIITFFILLFACILGTTLLFFKRIKLNLLLSIFLLTFPLLHFFHLSSPLNLTLDSALFLTLYFLLK
jgi:hypothetical protein